MERNCPAGRPLKQATRPLRPAVVPEVATTSDSNNARLTNSEWPPLLSAGSKPEISVTDKRKELSSPNG